MRILGQNVKGIKKVVTDSIRQDYTNRALYVIYNVKEHELYTGVVMDNDSVVITNDDCIGLYSRVKEPLTMEQVREDLTRELYKLMRSGKLYKPTADMQVTCNTISKRDARALFFETCEDIIKLKDEGRDVLQLFVDLLYLTLNTVRSPNDIKTGFSLTTVDRMAEDIYKFNLEPNRWY